MDMAEIYFQDFKLWLEKSIETDDFSNCTVQFIGTTGKSDGYASYIYFLDIQGMSKNKEIKKLQAVVKVAKQFETFREVFVGNEPIKSELYFYSVIMPAFYKLLEEKHMINTFDVIPKCLRTLHYNNVEIIVLENLKQQGFKLHDARKSLNLEHIKLLYKSYAKYHAISFALCDQNKSEFKKLTSDYKSLLPLFLLEDKMKKLYPSKLEKIYKILCGIGKYELVEKLKKKIEKGVDFLFDKVLNAQVKESVLIHGDCWNNNFMFKYENNSNIPCSVRLLDFQVCFLHSPALDLSSILYLTGCQDEISHFEELVKYYYDCFSSFLRELGSDPEKLFPYSTLINHWKRYCAHGALMVLMTLHVIMSEKDDAKSFEDFADSTELFTRDTKIKDMDLYRNRIYEVALHFCSMYNDED